MPNPLILTTWFCTQADAIREGYLGKNPYQDVKLCPDRDNDDSLNHVLTRE